MHVNVTLVGLDRISASFGLALKRHEKDKGSHTFTIIGNDPKVLPMKDAKKMGAVDDFERGMIKAIGNANLVVISAPYGIIGDLYEAIGPNLKPGAVVFDFSLHKQSIIELANAHFPRNNQGQPLAYVVGITPVIAASGLYKGDTGVEGASADLFEKAEFLVTPDAKTPSEAIDLAGDVLQLVGGKTRFMDPGEHDGLIAVTEELPMLVGTSLFYLLQRSEGWKELRRMVNPTLALMLQNLRTTSAQDMQALFTQNRANLLRNLEAYIGLLDQIRDTLADENEEALDAYLALVQAEWEKWDIKRFSGEWDDVAQIEVLPGPLGSMTGFMQLTRRKKDKEEDD